MDVTVIGCGYVGLVTGTCLANIGHTVRGVEKDPKKLKTLLDGHCPIFEPGLHELMQEHFASGQLQFTDNVKTAVKDAEVVFLCVGTPSQADGTVDMSFLQTAGKEVCDAMAENESDYMVTIVVKSTVPAGTNRKLYNFLKQQTNAYVQVVSNPEFLKEGTAVQDCLKPDRIVIGGESPEAFRMMRRLYDPLVKPEDEDKFLTMNWEIGRADQVRRQHHAGRPHFVHERDDDPLRSIRRGHRRHPQGHRLRQPHRPGVPAGRLRLRRKLLPQGRRRHGAHLQGSRLRKPVRQRHPGGQQEPEEALRRQDRAEAGPADRPARRSPSGAWRSKPTPTTSANRPRWT